jgi:hypothetical protein
MSIPAHSGDLERSFRSIMNTDSGDHEHPHEPARAGLASGMRSCWFVATDGCPVTFFPFGRQAVSAPGGAFSRGTSNRFPRPDRPSIAAEAAWWHDCLEFREVEIGDGLEGFGRGGVAEPVGQGVEPGNEFGLQDEQLGDRVVPALWPRASVGRPSIANRTTGIG